MTTLLINAFEPNGPHESLVMAATSAVTDPLRRDLVGSPFERFMTSEERQAYHSDQPLITDETRAAAQDVGAARALLFAYPTMAGTVPAVLKNWLERVLVPGVGFVFDAKGRVAPGLIQIVRLGAVTVQPPLRGRRDGGRRTILRTIRLNAAKRCRTTWVTIPEGDPEGADERGRRALSGW